MLWSGLMLHKQTLYLSFSPSLPGRCFFLFFFSFFIQWHKEYVLIRALQHCSILSGAELVLNVVCALQIPSPRSCQPNGANEEALQYEIEELKQKDLALDQEIAQLLSEYVLGNFSVHCDASVIFVFKTKCGPGIRAKSWLLMMPFLSWCYTMFSTVMFWVMGPVKDKREFFLVYLSKQNKFY